MASDLMSGVLTANQAIGNINPMGNFVQGMQDSQDLQKKQMENAKTQYQQDLTVKLQRAIHASVDPTSGDIDPKKFKVEAHKYGVDPQGIDYALEHVLKVWNTAKGVAQAKNAVGAVSETAVKEVEEAAKPAGTSWTTSNAGRGSMAVPTAPKKEEKDTTGFTTPDMEAGPSYKMVGSSVEGQGQTANDYSITPDPNSLMTGDAPKAPEVPGLIEAIGNIQPDAGTPASDFPTVTNPLNIADLSMDTQNRILASMRQEGKLPDRNAKNPDGTPMKRSDYLALAQKSADAQFALAQSASAVKPTKRMFIDKDGNIDTGAYEKAKAEYPAKQAAATKAYQDEMAKKYGENLLQELQVAANKRAETASKQSKTSFDQTQDRISAINETPFEGGKLNKGVTADNVGDIEKDLASYRRIQGAVKTIDDLLANKDLDKLSADQLTAKLKNFNTTMGQVEGLSTNSQRETLEEGLRKDPAGQSLIRKYFTDAELSIHGLLDALKKTNIEKWTAQDRRTFLTLLGDPARDALAHGAAATALRGHATSPEQAPASEPSKDSGWSKKKAKGSKAPKKESPLERLRRLRGGK